VKIGDTTLEEMRKRDRVWDRATRYIGKRNSELRATNAGRAAKDRHLLLELVEELVRENVLLAAQVPGAKQRRRA
jgi:hypothetical protein